MRRRPPTTTRTDTLFPPTTLFLSAGRPRAPRRQAPDGAAGHACDGEGGRRLRYIIPRPHAAGRSSAADRLGTRTRRADGDRRRPGLPLRRPGLPRAQARRAPLHSPPPRHWPHPPSPHTPTPPARPLQPAIAMPPRLFPPTTPHPKPPPF